MCKNECAHVKHILCTCMGNMVVEQVSCEKIGNSCCFYWTNINSSAKWPRCYSISQKSNRSITANIRLVEQNEFVSLIIGKTGLQS